MKFSVRCEDEDDQCDHIGSIASVLSSEMRRKVR
jgi:hypothetical protein